MSKDRLIDVIVRQANELQCGDTYDQLMALAAIVSNGLVVLADDPDFLSEGTREEAAVLSDDLVGELELAVEEASGAVYPDYCKCGRSNPGSACQK